MKQYSKSKKPSKRSKTKSQGVAAAYKPVKSKKGHSGYLTANGQYAGSFRSFMSKDKKKK